MLLIGGQPRPHRFAMLGLFGASSDWGRLRSERKAAERQERFQRKWAEINRREAEAARLAAGKAE